MLVHPDAVETPILQAAMKHILACNVKNTKTKKTEASTTEIKAKATFMGVLDPLVQLYDLDHDIVQLFVRLFDEKMIINAIKIIRRRKLRN